MRWKRLGKIFDPHEVDWLEGQCGYAQSPQTLVFDNFVRIYFATRVRDESGAFLSHIAFVDFAKDFSRVLGHSAAPVIELGKLGSFDEHGIFPMNPVRVGEKVYAFTTGWSRRKSVPVDASIGLAISANGGATFEKVGEGPVLGPSLVEPFLVGDAFVREFAGKFHMWYIYGTRWIRDAAAIQPDRIYKIGHAVSTNCVEWVRTNHSLIADRLDADECQALPTVLHRRGRYHMWFCYRHATNFRTAPARGYRIGYAYSEDLSSWTRDDNGAGIEVATDGWDSEMLCYPHVFECEGRTYLLYNGNEFGRSGFGLAVLED